MKVFSIILVYNLMNLHQCNGKGLEQCKTLRPLTKHGDVTIAGLFPIHLYNSVSMKYELNLNAVAWGDAMIFAINKINTNTSILQNVSIGYTIYDTCNEIETAMKIVLALILDHDNKAENNVTQNQELFAKQTSRIFDNSSTKQGSPQTNFCPCTKKPSRITSLIGGASSKISASISNLLSIDLIPQISYSSTSIGLSNKHTYPNFLRTIPPDNFQSQFIVDILEHYNWKFVNVLASDDEYGRVGVNYLLPQLQSRGICVGVLDIFPTLLELDDLERTVQKIINEEVAKVTIMWSGKQLARSVMALAAKMSLYNRTWIATEAWGSDEELLKVDSRVVAGLFGVVSSMIPYQPLEAVKKSVIDPSLAKHFGISNCSILPTNEKSCNEKHIFRNSSQFYRDKISNVIDAVDAFSLGLDAIVGNTSLHNIDHSLLLQSIKNVRLKGETGTNKTFDNNGDPKTATYSLVNLKASKEEALGFQFIARWNSKTRKIEFAKHANIYYAGDGISIPESKCGDDCQPGFYALKQIKKKCCWTCVRCSYDNYKSSIGTDDCIRCPPKSISNKNHTGCIELEEKYLEFQSAYGITLMITSMAGFVASIISVSTFVMFRNTPVVKSSNKDLSILQLCTSALAFLYPLFYIGKPSVVICYLRPLVFGILFTISNSIIFNKADRLLRIFKMRHRILSGQILLSNSFQFFIVLVLVMISVMICLSCFMSSPPIAVEEVFRENNSIRVKCENISTPILILIGYINTIGVACITYTFKSRNLPRQYREKRYIGLAMFVTTLTWIIFIPLSLSGTQSSDVKSFVFCLATQIANTMLLLVIYGPKTWIMLTHPEENTTAMVHGNHVTGHASTVKPTANKAFVVPSRDETSIEHQLKSN